MRDLDDHLSNHPTVNLLTLASSCDAIISDDRMLNQHANVGEDDSKTPAFTTIDLIDALAAKGVISAENRLEYRTRLRQAGYFFIPLDEDELVSQLSASNISDNRVIETAELKAIRENILLVRMRDYLRIPQEFPWLSAMREIIIRTLKSLWKEAEDYSETRIRSNWLLELSDLRGWLHRTSSDSKEQIARNAHIAMVLSLFTVPSDQPAKVVEAYWEWFEDVLLLPTKEQFPDIYAWIISYQKDQIARISEKSELFMPEAK
jgi:hypothetical protein